MQKRAKAFGEVRVVVGDDAVRDAVPNGDIRNECDGSRTIQLFDWPRLNPLRELVHGNQQMGHAATYCLEWARHVQPPHGKRPSEGDGLQCRSRQVLLGAEALASLALADQLLGVVQSSQPKEAMAESFGDKGFGGSMVATFALMDIS